VFQATNPLKNPSLKFHPFIPGRPV